MKFLLLLTSIVVSSLAATLSFAGEKDHSTAKGSTTEAEAKATALKLVPGKVVEVEQEKHYGEATYSIEILANDGVHEVLVRISDGSVVENNLKGQDDDDDENEK